MGPDKKLVPTGWQQKTKAQRTHIVERRSECFYLNMNQFEQILTTIITLKITRIRHEPEKRFGKEININQKLKEFYDEINKHKLEDIICIDETSISGLQKRHQCYTLIHLQQLTLEMQLKMYQKID